MFWKRQRKLKLELIHVETAMSGIFCFGREGIEDLTEADSRHLLQGVQSLTSASIRYQNPWEWELSVDTKFSTVPLKKVMHQEMSPYLPCGKKAGEWKRWMTEVQMLLHQDPLNQKRESLNQKTVNWLWIEFT